jgi:Transposase Tn5 dimerisation domain/Transposase DNA-binding
MPDDFTDEFADADLKDSRRSRRLGMVAAALGKSPAASISAASGGWSETMAAYRLLNCGDFAPKDLIAPHGRATATRCAGHSCVAVCQDTTEFDFTHMKATKGLGPLNDEHRRGFFMHSHYVVSEQGLPLGLLDADIMLRDDATFRSTAARKQRPTAEKESQRRIIDLYMRRWDIEVFHRVLKTGCRVESIQLKTGRAVIHALMIYAVIAWRILYLTHLGRQCPDLPCGCVFEEAEWKSACAVVKRKKDAGEPSLSEFIGIIGKLGGHLGRKSDGAPGPQSIWQGLARIRDFACAWHAFHGE